MREPRRANDRAVTWKELDADGNEVGRYTQLDARVDTRWVWWLGAIYKRLMSIGGETQYVAMCALSIAGAYNLDFTVPMWVRQHVFGSNLGPNPMMLLFVILMVGGACIAAAVPLLEVTLLLYNAQSRVEVRLSEGKGYQREPTNIPGRTNAWVLVCDGSFAKLPRDLAILKAQRSQHWTFLACVGLAVAWVVANAGRREEPPYFEVVIDPVVRPPQQMANEEDV